VRERADAELCSEEAFEAHVTKVFLSCFSRSYIKRSDDGENCLVVLNVALSMALLW
jgi:hypothetical protein